MLHTHATPSHNPPVLKPLVPSIYGSSHVRWATLADGLDDAVAAGVHHERFFTTLLDIGHLPIEGDDAEGVHQERLLPPLLDTGHLLAKELVLKDAGGVVQDLALLTGAFALDLTRATLDTARARFLMHLLRTRLTSTLDTALLHWVPLSAWPGHAHSTMRCPRVMG